MTQPADSKSFTQELFRKLRLCCGSSAAAAGAAAAAAAAAVLRSRLAAVLLQLQPQTLQPQSHDGVNAIRKS
jgi:hypothetical protein